MMWPSEREWNTMMVFLCILVAVAGWCVIEAFLWVWRHIHVAWN